MCLVRYYLILVAFWHILKIRNVVKEFLNITPKDLRIAALQFCAANFGAEYINNCLGLSITQAESYSKIGEELLDYIAEASLEEKLDFE
ncbi:hypothetical protein V7068_11035 [Bacillus sp. JJ634]